MKIPASALQIKKLLVPVDFSECSREAVGYAVALAKQFNSEIVLLHVLDPYIGTGDMALDVTRMQFNFEKEAHDMLQMWVGELCPNAKVMMRIGPPAREIIEVAKEIEATAIIISSHGRGAVARFFIGGVAERVVRHANCPVIVLPWKKRQPENPFTDAQPQREVRPEAAQPRRQYEPIT